MDTQDAAPPRMPWESSAPSASSADTSKTTQQLPWETGASTLPAPQLPEEAAKQKMPWETQQAPKADLPAEPAPSPQTEKQRMPWETEPGQAKAPTSLLPKAEAKARLPWEAGAGKSTFWGFSLRAISFMTCLEGLRGGRSWLSLNGPHNPTQKLQENPIRDATSDIKTFQPLAFWAMILPTFGG